MTCPWRQRLPRTEHARREFQGHLAGCEACSKMRDALQGASACPDDETLARFLGGERSEEIELHLAACRDCRDVVRFAIQEPEGPATREFKRRIIDRVTRQRKVSPLSIPWYAVAVAALALIAILVAVVSRHPPATTTPSMVKQPEPRPQTSPHPDPGPKVVREEPGQEPPKQDPQTAPQAQPPEPPREPPKQETVMQPPGEQKQMPVEPPGQPAEPPTELKPPCVVMTRVQGEILINDQPAKAGDRVTDADRVRTRFGTHGWFEAAGARITMHHQTELRLSEGPTLRLATGRIFVRSTPGLRVQTAAGLITPIGTEFSVEVLGETTIVAVREGSVLLQTPRGRSKLEKGQLVSCAAGKVPGAVQRLMDPAACFGWVTRIGAENYLMHYPAARRTGAVIAAPHAPYETHTALMAASVAEKLRLPLVVGHGYASRDNFSVVNVPGQNRKEREVFEEYVHLIRDAAGLAPARLLVELHGYGGPAVSDKDPTPVIECSTAGFSQQELLRLKQVWVQLLKKHKPEQEVALVFDLTDPQYEVEGRKIEFRFTANTIRSEGAFKKDVTARGLKFELPWQCRKTPRARQTYEAMVSELLETLPEIRAFK